jgi:hypothetical protein
MDQGRRFKGEVTEKRRNDTNTVLDVDFKKKNCNSVLYHASYTIIPLL